MLQDNVFDPVLYSIEENKFLLETAGQPPVVARKAIPASVNQKAVLPVLIKLNELAEQEKHSGLIWAGVPAVKAAIQTYLEQAEKWATDRRRGRKRFPSMYTYDSRGKGHFYGPGSDAGQVRSYFDKAGNRVPFAIELVPAESAEWTPDWQTPDDPGPGSDVYNNHEMNRIECFCGHVEKYKAESRGSYNAARGRISKHLRNATDEVERHREAHTNEFGN